MQFVFHADKNSYSSHLKAIHLVLLGGQFRQTGSTFELGSDHLPMGCQGWFLSSLSRLWRGVRFVYIAWYMRPVLQVHAHLPNRKMMINNNEWCSRPGFRTVRLYWARNNPGYWDEFWYEWWPGCRINHSTCWPAVQPTELPSIDQIDSSFVEYVSEWLKHRTQYLRVWGAIPTCTAPVMC